MTGGGSGGHITPLVSLAHALKQQVPDCRVVYIGLKGEVLESELGKRYQIFDEVRHVTSGKFRRYHGESFLVHLIDFRTLGLNVRDFFKVLAGIISARKILRQVRPDAVLSKGGFVVVPVGIAARMLKIPIITHDSDAVPGLANRIVGRFAKIHTTGMPTSYYKYPQASMHYVGIPLDERIKPVTAEMQRLYKKELGFKPESLVLLVGGAGHGARDVNNTILGIAPELLTRFENLNLIHIAGQKNIDAVKTSYRNMPPDHNKRVMVLGFTPDFYRYTGAADLVVTRAGATTIAEAALQAKPLILIPAPHLTGGHQIKNANFVKKAGAAKVVDNDADPDELLQTISRILSDEVMRKKMSAKMGALAKPEAANQLAGLIIATARKSHSQKADTLS